MSALTVPTAPAEHRGGPLAAVAETVSDAITMTARAVRLAVPQPSLSRSLSVDQG